MQASALVRVAGKGEELAYVAVIVVPEQALTEAGHIRALVGEAGGQSKHLFQAMAQTAYFLAQDDELALRSLAGPLRCLGQGETVVLVQGLLIGRTQAGGLEVLVVGAAYRKKLLEVAHRYCTRWVRLDI